jgi:hypothetical protein
MKQFQLGDLFTEEEIDKATEIMATGRDAIGKHQRLKEEVVQPVMPRIAAATNQENDPDYLAYLLEWVVLQSRGDVP